MVTATATTAMSIFLARLYLSFLPWLPSRSTGVFGSDALSSLIASFENAMGVGCRCSTSLWTSSTCSSPQMRPKQTHQWEPIYPELIVVIILWWLRGCPYKDIAKYCDTSKNSFYRWRNIFLESAICCTCLHIRFPSTLEDLTKTRKEFSHLRANMVIRVCVGLLGGFLQKILVLSFRDTPCTKFFFSGNYHMFGANVQTIFNEWLHFTYLCIAVPGN